MDFEYFDFEFRGTWCACGIPGNQDFESNPSAPQAWGGPLLIPSERLVCQPPQALEGTSKRIYQLRTAL